jgi:hypothetical protein
MVKTAVNLVKSAEELSDDEDSIEGSEYNIDESNNLICVYDRSKKIWVFKNLISLDNVFINLLKYSLL